MCHFAVNSSDLHGNGLVVETISVNGQVLATTSVTNMRTDVEDDWNIHGIVALLHVKRAVFAASIVDLGIADLPEHLEIFVVANWHLSDPTLDKGGLTENLWSVGTEPLAGLIIDKKLEV